MGALVGLVAGLGGWLIWRSGPRAPQARPRSRPTLSERTADLLGQAGYDGIRPHQLYVVCLACAAVTFVAVAGVSRVLSIAIAFSCFAAYLPVALVRRRRRQRTTELREIWPEVTDNLASAVRAGMSLPEALAALSVRGPASLRPTFATFAEDYRATGRFGDCLDRLKDALADPCADKIAESLRVARDVGGGDLGRLLRTLSQFLRDEARARAELETRQGWTIGAARLALAAPWIVLGMLSLRPETVRAYDTPLGVAILLTGAVVSIGAYQAMLRIGRLPSERRVLR